MTAAAKRAIEAIRTDLHEHVKDLGEADYADVLQVIVDDCEGNLDAISEEEPNQDEDEDDGICDLRLKKGSPMQASQLTTLDLVRSLTSTVCLACGGRKEPRKTFCSNEYFKLPPGHRRLLYSLVGEGYEQAVADALEFLAVTEPKLPGKG